MPVERREEGAREGSELSGVRSAMVVICRACGYRGGYKGEILSEECRLTGNDWNNVWSSDMYGDGIEISARAVAK